MASAAFVLNRSATLNTTDDSRLVIPSRLIAFDSSFLLIFFVYSMSLEAIYQAKDILAKSSNNWKGHGS